ncbi:MAG: lipid A-modifier LpxR family protein [Pseudomonadota bacterium]
MISRSSFLFGTMLAAGMSTIALADGANDGERTFNWISETDEVQAEGIVWNDHLGDGADRWKTGGLTQSFVFPQSMLSEEPWFDHHAAAVELQVRGLLITPDNTSAVGSGDRPYAQYLALGGYLRLWGQPDYLGAGFTTQTEDRLGIELGYQGEPLPLFEIADAFHRVGNMPTTTRTDANTLDGEFLANVEARRTLRMHGQLGPHDLNVAPFAQVSAGMRENSARVGTDIILGTSLEARTWNYDTGIGALIPGGAKYREGIHWAMWIGGDIGYVASDAFLDGGFSGNGPSVSRTPVTARARAGLIYDYEDVSFSFSLNWLSAEFETQSEGQMIGALQVEFAL